MLPQPGHVHLQVPGLMRVSRAVQWMREAARRDPTDLRRIAEEVVDTALYLRMFVGWLYAGRASGMRGYTHS